MTTRFKNVIDALVYAFFNDTLAKGDCVCCAVGNICAWTHGIKLKDLRAKIPIGKLRGEVVFHHDWAELVWNKATEVETKKGLKVISKTGYTPEELAMVEQAFEGATMIMVGQYEFCSKKEITEDQYNGLCAVVDVLCEIEGIEDPSEYKEMFAFQS